MGGGREIQVHLLIANVGEAVGAPDPFVGVDQKEYYRPSRRDSSKRPSRALWELAVGMDLIYGRQVTTVDYCQLLFPSSNSQSELKILF